MDGVRPTTSCSTPALEPLAGQIALAWILGREQKIIPIPGTKRIKYLEENCGAASVQLSASERAALEALLPIGGAAGTRYDPNFGGAPKAATS